MAYALLLLGMVFNEFSFAYSIDCIYFIVFYYLLALCAILNIYQYKDKRLLVIISLLLLFLSPYPLIFIPSFVLFVLSFNKGFSSRIKIATHIITFVGILVFFVYIIVYFHQASPINNSTLLSPDKNKIIVCRYFDTENTINVQFKQGILDNNLIISRVLYSTNGKNKLLMKWLDNNTVLINGKRINVYSTLMVTDSYTPRIH